MLSRLCRASFLLITLLITLEELDTVGEEQPVDWEAAMGPTVGTAAPMATPILVETDLDMT